MANLTPLEPFICDGDIGSVGVKWEKWKRGLEIYLEAANIQNPIRKRATLLHSGGLGLQEIYYNLPGAHVPESEGTNDGTINVFGVALEKLDQYFSPKQSKVYERHIFRLMKQEVDEKFEKFLVRLRNQASKCKFPNEEENLIDQIVEKCQSTELKKKILTIGDTVNLDTIVKEAIALETVTRQLQQFSEKEIRPEAINKININRKQGQKYHQAEVKACYRCGSTKHFASNCPEINSICNKCGFKGHIRQHCRTRANKRRSSERPITKQESKRSRYSKPKQENEDDRVDYVFHVDHDYDLVGYIAGIPVEMVVDSGSTCNILSDKTWQQLKTSKVKVFNQIKNPKKVFMAYASKKPLDILGCFDAEIKINVTTTSATFYVIKNGTKNLLGRKTAKSLGVLRIGTNVNVNYVSTFPKFKNVLINIPIDENVRPVVQPYRRIPIPLESKVNDKIKELVDSDIVEPVDIPSKWISPIVPVLKPNGDIRICIDMRQANKAILRENHPLPTMDQLSTHFRKAKLFSRLDIKNAFHQIEISENSRHITTFISSKGLFRYKRLMFGISCAPEIFQKILERILAPCDGTVNFIDDIVIYGENEIEHNKRLKNALKTLHENDVLLNESKCIYNISVIQFLGHELSPNGMKPLDKYISVIKKFRTPNTIDELQSFLGLVNYIGKWIVNLATVTEPLRELLRLKLKKNEKIGKYWQRNQNIAFHKLKDSLSTIETLGYYDPQDKTRVIADASPVGLGTVLIQYDSKGPRIIAYGNKSLSDCEKRYCQTEKEALALVWAVEHFHIYLYGKKEFELVTDHKPLEVIFGTKSKPCARIERWVLRLQSYNFKVVYRPGKTNIADPLSRLCVNEIKCTSFDEDEHIQQIVEYSRPVAISLSDIAKYSKSDLEILKVKKWLSSNEKDDSVKHFQAFQTELCFYEDILLRGNKIVIPSILRQNVLQAAHEGHPGIVAMKSRLRTKVWWPKIDSDAEKLVRSCKGCTLVAAPNPPHPIKRRQLPTEAWIDVAIDFLGPLPSAHYLLVIIDYFSRYKEIKIMTTITASNTIKALKEIFSRLGYPTTITADNGKQFSGSEIRDFCKESGIKLFNTIPYWPQQNGEVERQNRDIVKRLKISRSMKTDWKQDLFDYLMMYNATPHSTTGKTPAELFFRRQFRDKIPTLRDMENKITDDEVRDYDMLKKTSGKEYSDRKRKAQESTIGLGDKVYIKNMIKENKLTPNFNPTPHTVIEKNDGDVEVKNDETGQQYRRNVVNLKKKWKGNGR